MGFYPNMFTQPKIFFAANFSLMSACAYMWGSTVIKTFEIAAYACTDSAQVFGGPIKLGFSQVRILPFLAMQPCLFTHSCFYLTDSPKVNACLSGEFPVGWMGEKGSK